jgi:hypothetical protein
MCDQKGSGKTARFPGTQIAHVKLNRASQPSASGRDFRQWAGELAVKRQTSQAAEFVLPSLRKKGLEFLEIFVAASFKLG